MVNLSLIPHAGTCAVPAQSCDFLMMKPRPILMPKLANPAFATAFAAAHGRASIVLPLDHFDDLGTVSVMLSVAEAENAQPAGSRTIIVSIGEDIRPLLALMAYPLPLPRLTGLAVDYHVLKAALPGPAFTTHIGMVLLAAHALKVPANILGGDSTEPGFLPLELSV